MTDGMTRSFQWRIKSTTAMSSSSKRKETSMARKFKELEARMSPEAIPTSDATYHRLKETMALEELRQALRMTQQELAKTLNVDQSAISKLERRTDMYVSTL